jgi:hypothetical protein
MNLRRHAGSPIDGVRRQFNPSITARVGPRTSSEVIASDADAKRRSVSPVSGTPRVQARTRSQPKVATGFLNPQLGGTAGSRGPWRRAHRWLRLLAARGSASRSHPRRKSQATALGCILGPVHNPHSRSKLRRCRTSLRRNDRLRRTPNRSPAWAGMNLRDQACRSAIRSRKARLRSRPPQHKTRLSIGRSPYIAMRPVPGHRKCRCCRKRRQDSEGRRSRSLRHRNPTSIAHRRHSWRPTPPGHDTAPRTPGCRSARSPDSL